MDWQQPRNPSRRTVLKTGALGVAALAGARLAPLSAVAAEPGLSGEAGRDVIWDLHFHLSGVPGNTPAERIAKLMPYADRMGIDRLCLFMGFPFTRDPLPADLRKENDQVLSVLEKHPDRLFGFAYVSGNHVEASLAEIDRCVRNGPMVGIKLWVARQCNAAELDAIVQETAKLQGVIYQHTWVRTDGSAEREAPGESTPAHLVELAKRNPTVPLICGHTGGTWELGIRTVRAIPTISIDLAGSDPTNGLVEMAVRELGAERIIYGSDAGGRCFASQLAKVYGADLPDATRKLILAGNLRRMLTPILQRKGVKF